MVLTGAGTTWEAYWVRQAAKVLVRVGVAMEREERHYAKVMEGVFGKYLAGRGCSYTT